MRVHKLHNHTICLMQGEGSTGSSPPMAELVLDLEDGFHRLIGHGLAEFHGLGSFSRAEPDGTKRLVLRCRRGAGEGGLRREGRLESEGGGVEG